MIEFISKLYQSVKKSMKASYQHRCWGILEREPHAICVGGTGSGKSYATLLALARLSLHVPDAQIYFCDYKGDDSFIDLYGAPLEPCSTRGNSY